MPSKVTKCRNSYGRKCNKLATKTVPERQRNRQRRQRSRCRAVRMNKRRRLRSVCLTANLRSISRRISGATLTIPKIQRPLPSSRVRIARGGAVLRGTHGLMPEKLEDYLKMRVAEYSKGCKWLPKDSHLQWLKKEIVTVDGRKWADWRFVPMLKGKKDYSHNPVYTRFLTTSYKGQLLEINFTSNLNTAPELKAEIDHIMDSVHLEE